MKKTTTILIVLAAVVFPAALHAQMGCAEAYDTCIADCRSFGDPLTACGGFWQPCSSCCQYYFHRCEASCILNGYDDPLCLDFQNLSLGYEKIDRATGAVPGEPEEAPDGAL